MAILWLTEAIPIPVTALLPIFLFPMLQVAGARDISASYITVSLITVKDQKYFHKINFPIDFSVFSCSLENISWHYCSTDCNDLVLIESWCITQAINFLSYRLFILCLNYMPLNLTFGFLVTFFATSPLTSLETCCFQISYKV